MKRSGGWLAVVCAAIGLWTCGAAGAGQDYEYVRGLVEKTTYEDLIARLVKKLKGAPDKSVQLDGVLASAFLKRREALRAQPNEQAKLLEEAKGLYESYLQDGSAKTHRLYMTAQGEAATIDLDVANSLMRAADDEKDAAKAQGLRRKASDMFSRVSAQLMAAVKALEPSIVELRKEIQKEMKDDDPTAPIPEKLVPKIDKVIGDFYRADAKYCQAIVAEIRALPEGDAGRKDKVKTFQVYIDKRAQSEELLDYPILTQRYYFFLAQAHQEAGDYKKADEYFQGALDAVDMEQIAPAAKKMVNDVVRAITIEKVKMKMKQKDYRGVAKDIRRFLYEDMPKLREEPLGKELQMEMARALSKGDDPDWSAACKEACVVIEGGGPFAVQARQVLTEIIDSCPAKERRNLTLPPEQWFEVAKGYYEKGSDLHQKHRAALEKEKDNAKAAELYKEACESLERAIDSCRRTIMVLRARSTPLNVRLKLEPQCWSRMGLSYCKMGCYHEAIIACQAGLRNFSDPAVLKMLKSDPKAGKNIQTVTLVKDKETEEDKLAPEVVKKLTDNMPPAFGKGMFDELISSVQQCRNNCRYALTENQRLQDSMFNRKLYVDGMKVLGGPKESEGYYLMNVASRLLASAQDLARQGKVDESAKEYQNVKARCEDAIKLFEKSDPTSPEHENTVFQQGICSYLLFNLTLADRMGFKKEEKPLKLKDYAKRCLDYFAEYEKLMKKPRLDEAGIARRRQNLGRLKGYRALLHYGTGEYEKAIELTDDYLKYEKDEPDPDLKPRILFEKFRALLEVAEQKPPVDCFKPMADAEAMGEIFKDDVAREKVIMQMLAYRWNVLAKKVEKDENLFQQMDLRATQWQERLLSNRERSGQALTLDEMLALANRHRRTGSYDKAFDLIRKAIQQYDPEGRNRILPDTTWAQYWAKMKAMIRLDDYDKTQRCKKDHETLLDLLNHEPQNFKKAVKDRPPTDLYDRDYPRAGRKLDDIRNEYKGVQTDRPELGPVQGKSYLHIIGEEIDFRMKILRARDVLCDIALQMADIAKKAGQEDRRKECLDVVTKQMELLLNEYQDAPEVELKRAEILVQSGKYQEAMTVFWAIRNEAPPDSDQYVTASIDISKCALEMGNLNEAVRFPHFLLVTAGENSAMVKKYWPDIRLFVDKCYAAGSPKLDAMKIKRPPRQKGPAEIKFEILDKKFAEFFGKPEESSKLSGTFWFDYAEATWNVSEEYKGFVDRDKFLTKDFLKRLRVATERTCSFQEKEAKIDEKSRKMLVAEYRRRLDEIKKTEEYVDKLKEVKPEPESKPEEGKPEDKKTEDKKTEDKKAEDKKAGEKKAEEKKADDKKGEEKKPEEKKE